LLLPEGEGGSDELSSVQELCDEVAVFGEVVESGGTGEVSSDHEEDDGSGEDEEDAECGGAEDLEGFHFVLLCCGLLLIRLLYTTIDAVYTMRCNILQEFGNKRRVRFGDDLRGLPMRVNNLSSTRTEPQRVRRG